MYTYIYVYVYICLPCLIQLPVYKCKTEALQQLILEQQSQLVTSHGSLYSSALLALFFTLAAIVFAAAAPHKEEKHPSR